MLEYGNDVGQGAGRVTGGGGGGGGGSTDMSAQIGRAFNDSVHTLSTMPPAALLGIVVAIVIGLWVLKRAF
jgi:hypothetical protein